MVDSRNDGPPIIAFESNERTRDISNYHGRQSIDENKQRGENEQPVHRLFRFAMEAFRLV